MTMGNDTDPPVVTPVQVNQSNRGDKARVGTDEFLRTNGLDPKDWHLSSNVPVQAKDPKDPNLLVPNTYTVTAIGPLGEVRTLTLVPLSGTVPANTPLDQVDWNVTSVDQTIRPATSSPAQAQADLQKAQNEAKDAETRAKVAQAAYEQTQRENAERAANQANTGYFVTDKERADMENQAKQAGLDQSRIDAQLRIASDSNKQSAISNEIAAKNAATNAFIAQKNAEIEAARLGVTQEGADLDKIKQTALEAQNAIVNAQNDRKLALDELTQQQAAETAKGQLAATQQANVLRGQELAQRGQEVQQTAETAAQGQRAQAAASAYSTERTAQQQAAQTGQNLLQNRETAFQNLANAPFTAAGNLSRGSAGRFGQLSGGGVHLPAGAIGDLMSGSQGLATAMFGGQNAIDAATQAIEGIRPGAALTPMGQAAAAALTQIIDGARRTSGNVPAPATAGGQPAPAPAAAAPVAAPATVPNNNALGQGTQVFPGLSGPENAMPLYPNAQPVGAAVGAMLAPQTMKPVTSEAPTVNLYIGGGGGTARVM